MQPKNRHTSKETQQRRFPLFGVFTERNPLTNFRWVLRWTVVGTASGLFAGLYWNVLELITHFLKMFEGFTLLIVMSLAGLVIGLVIQFLDNLFLGVPLIDNQHLPKGRIAAISGDCEIYI